MPSGVRIAPSPRIAEQVIDVGGVAQDGTVSLGKGAWGTRSPRMQMTTTPRTSAGAGDAPADAAPGWLRLMMLLGSRLPLVEAPEGTGPRAVVAAPTTRHLAAAMAVGTMRSAMEQPGAALSVDQRVATVISRRFCDTDVRAFGQRLSLEGVQFDPQRVPPAAVLDPAWEIERGPHVIPQSAIDAAQLLGRKGYPAEWTYFRFCLNPVLVITPRPTQVAEDLAELAQVEDWWNPFQRLALASPEEGVDMWFRRPVVITSPAALAGAPWVAGLPVSLIVVAGFAAWLSPHRHCWSKSPQVLLLNQRTADVADFRAWFDGALLPEVQLPGAKSRDLRRSGLTLATFGEPIMPRSVEGVGRQEVDEWEF